MKQIMARDPTQEFNVKFLEQLQTLLCQHLNLKKEQLPTIDKCISEYVSYEENLQAMMQIIVDQKQFSKVNRVLKMM
jgi:hypothetical protein